MFTLCSAKKLLTPDDKDLISLGVFANTHGGIKVYCTGNPNNLRDYPVFRLLKGSQRIRPIDYLYTGKRYWGKFTKTCAVFVDGDSALISHEREKLLVCLSWNDHEGKTIKGTDLLIGTVYVEGKNKVHKYPISKYRKMFYLREKDYFTFRVNRDYGEEPSLYKRQCIHSSRYYNLPMEFEVEDDW